MDGVPLAARVVEVIVDLGISAPIRYRYGSGCRVSGKLVLTAAHVVADAVWIGVRGPDKKQVSGKSLLLGDPNVIDLALVELDGDVGQVPHMPLAAVDRTSLGAEVVERCHAIGYPQFKDFAGPDGLSIRETADVYGEIPVHSGLVGGLLTLQVSSAPENLPDDSLALGRSQWAGISGAPVVAGEYLIGVVSEHAPREGASAITVTPLSQLDPDPDRSWPGLPNSALWWKQLGAPEGVPALHLLPAPEKRGTRPYLPTVREIRRRTPQLIARQQELAEIAAFATSGDGYRWIVGQAWAGKTALAGEAMITAMPPNVDIVAYFLSRRQSDANSSHFLAVVIPQLAFLLNEDPPAPDWHTFLRLWEEALEAARGRDHHLLLIVDGLDEDLHPPGLPSVAALLPTAVGERGHVLVTSRPYPELPIDVPSRHPLRQAQPVRLRATEAAEEQRLLATQEIADLSMEASDLAIRVLGMMAAAAGPLAADDLIALMPSISVRSLHQFLKGSRTVQRVGPAGAEGYQFAHETLLQTCQQWDDLDVDACQQEIHTWAGRWRDAGWPTQAGENGTTPRYLLDVYPSTLSDQRGHLCALAADVGWIAAALQTVGVDRVVADLASAHSAVPTDKGVSAMLSVLRAQAPYLRSPQPVEQPGYVLRQLCLQAAELVYIQLVADIGTKLQVQAPLGPIPQWTTHRASRALSLELGGHGGRVRAVAVLPGGQVVSGGDDGRVRVWVWVWVWDPAAVASPLELVGHHGIVRAVAALPDGRVVSGGDDRRVLLWDPDAIGAPAVELGHHGREVRTLAVMPDGRVVSGGDDWRVLVWDPHRVGAASIGLNGHRGIVRTVAVLPDGRVVSGGDDRRVLLWDPGTIGAAPVELGGHRCTVRVVAVLPDGRIVSGGDDGRIRIWNPAAESVRYFWPSGAQARTLIGFARHRDRLRALAVLPDGRLVSGGDDWMRIWDLTPAHMPPVDLGCHDGMVRALAVLPEGRVVSGGEDRRVRVWDPSMATTTLVGLGNNSRAVVAVAVLPDGRVVSGGHDQRVLVWDVAPVNQARLALPLELGRHRRSVAAVAVLPDGRVVSGGDDGRVLMWHPATARTQSIELGRHSGEVRAVAVLPGGRVASGGEDRWVRIWDPAKPGAAPVEIGRHEGAVVGLAVLPDGESSVAGTNGAFGCGTR